MQLNKVDVASVEMEKVLQSTSDKQADLRRDAAIKLVVDAKDVLSDWLDKEKGERAHIGARVRTRKCTCRRYGDGRVSVHASRTPLRN